MSARVENDGRPVLAELKDLNICDVIPNDQNPRLDFPQDELDRLAGSIDHEGVLVPIVVYFKDEKYVLVDGERRFRCARDLGHETIPALITSERSDLEVLQQMFNIHLIREAWRDIPTALALHRLANELSNANGVDPTDQELRDLTGLSIERVRQLRYIVTLPDDWQRLIRDETIPLNFFWELKKVIDIIRSVRPKFLEEYGEEAINLAFVKKRLDKVITDTVSLRKVGPIIKFAAQDAATSEDDSSTIDQSFRSLIDEPDSTIEDAYDDTVQLMVEVDKLGRRTSSMVAAFSRLLVQTAGTADFEKVQTLGRQLIEQLGALINAGA